MNVMSFLPGVELLGLRELAVLVVGISHLMNIIDKYLWTLLFLANWNLDFSSSKVVGPKM